MKIIHKSLSLIVLLSLVISAMTVTYTHVSAEDEGENTYATDTLPDDAIFTNIDENGNIVEVKDSELNQSGIIEEDPYAVSTMTLMPTKDVKVTKGVVNFRTKSSTSNTSFTEDVTGREGYTNGTYAADGAYLGHSSDGKKVKFMQAGVIGWANASDVQVLDFSSSSVKTLSKYYVKDGRLYHGIVTNLMNSSYSSTLDVGPKPSYLTEGAEYYSYDGHYFYAYNNTNGYETMLKDYRNDTRANSVNPSNPYYNYYQYLPHRSQTVYTAAQLNSAITHFSSSNSLMRNLGQTFIDNQNKYGVNAIMTIGIAANESSWGTSNIALTKNNLFGHAAYDSDPNGSSNKYSTPAFSVYYHTSTFMSKQYCNPSNWKYHGSFLGDKESGINLKYASDPYWGEKAAATAWKIDQYLGGKDSYKYTVGIKDYYNYQNDSYQFRNSYIRKEASSSSTTLYKTVDTNSKVLSNYAFINIDKTLTNKYYKIQSDATLNTARTSNSSQAEYSFSRDYAYIYDDHVKMITKSGSSSSSGSSNSSGTTTPSTPSKTYLIGDVNGDDKVTSLDYIQIKNHIMKTKLLTGDALSRADVNKDGKVSSLDYIKIKNHIMGTNKLF